MSIPIVVILGDTRYAGTVELAPVPDSTPVADTQPESDTPPAPTLTPAPAPTGPNPFPGWPVIQSPSAMNQTGYGSGALDAGNPQTFAFSAPPNIIHAHHLRFEATSFLGNGAVIQHNQFTSNANPRDVWLSATPGGVKLGLAAMHVGSTLGSLMRVKFDGSGGFLNGATNLTKGVLYYLNVKAHDANTPVDYLISVSAQP